MSDPNGAVLLSNGAMEALGCIRATLLSLKSLHKDPMTFYDAVTLARDPSYQIFQKPRETMKEYGMINSLGQMHDSIRNIIVCAVKGDDFEMEILPLEKIICSKE
jgi:hypothetical protein